MPADAYNCLYMHTIPLPPVSCLGGLCRLRSTSNQLSVPRSLLHFFSCLGGALGSISLRSMAQPVLPRLLCIARPRFHFCFSVLVCHMTFNHTRGALNTIEPYAWGILLSHDINHTRESWRTYDTDGIDRTSAGQTRWGSLRLAPNTRASVCLSVQTITRAFVRLGASDSTRALLGVAGRSSSLSLAVCARPAKIRSLLRRHALVWAAILRAHAPRCNFDDLYPTGHVRRTGSY